MAAVTSQTYVVLKEFTDGYKNRRILEGSLWSPAHPNTDAPSHQWSESEVKSLLIEGVIRPSEVPGPFYDFKTAPSITKGEEIQEGPRS